MTVIHPALKQSLLPFSWNKKTGTADKSVSSLPVLFFDFCSDLSESDNKNIKYNINILPDTRNYFKDDIGIKQLIISDDNGKIKNVDINDILKLIPKIEIREYTQDTRLDLVFSLVDYFKRGYETGKGIAEDLNKDEAKIFGKMLIHDIKNLDSSQAIKGVMESLIKQVESVSNQSFYNKGSSTGDLGLVLRFTYGLYYRILNTRTTNIYKLPFSTNITDQGNGYQGFDTDFGMAGSSVLGNFGSLANFIAPNINITTTPIWRGVKGGEGTNIELSVNLFNDTLEHAIYNYILVNTIIPNNMPIQKGIMLGPPSLYDLKIPGSHRLFMCAGNFSCEYKGVLRTPSFAFAEAILGSINTLRNLERTSQISKEWIQNNIRIPDVYELKLLFKSLLPNNFNNYIYRFAMNDKIDDYSTKAEQQGIMVNDEITEKMDNWINTRKADAKNIREEIKKELFLKAVDAANEYYEREKDKVSDTNELYDMAYTFQEWKYKELLQEANKSFQSKYGVGLGSSN